MALILCQECKAMISNEALACPKCGCPTPLARDRENAPKYDGPAPPGVNYAICPYCGNEIRVTVPDGRRLLKVATYEFLEFWRDGKMSKARCVHCGETYRVRTVGPEYR
jgi:hypothetical protein